MSHPNKIAFEEGAGYIFKTWTALKLAVEQDWGGVDSGEKRDWMIKTIVDYFGQHGKKIDVYDVEDILAQIMLDEFHAQLDDDSPYLVAKHLVELYNQCIQGNYTEVERLRTKYQSQAPTTQSQKQTTDSDSEEDDDADGDDMDEDMDLDPQGPPPKQEPEIDEDGFQTVTYRRK